MGADKDVMRVFMPQVIKEQLRSLDIVDKEGAVYGRWETVSFKGQGGKWSSLSFREISLMAR